MAKQPREVSDYSKVMDKNKQWQKNMDLTPKGESNGWGAFLPRPGKERPTPHVKVNECDH